ncbi:phage tail tape measure protein [Salinicoccus carnicancri]|uniref:phage tail tape measure protein n=1 Tax=Salinicoccus carnicancri TaxID=558170 RepID=UPI00030B1C1C|nr:phage tail tape measure protein [Salinicoccus carnicancri]
MVDEVRGFNIELGLDHAGVDKGLKDLQRQMKITNSELDKNLSAFQRGEQSMERYEATIEGLNRKMNVQQNIVEESRRKLDSLKTAYDKQKQALDQAGRNVDNLKRKYDTLNKTYGEGAKELRESEKRLKSVEAEFDKLSTATEKATKEYEKVTREFGEGSKESQEAGRALKKQTDELQTLTFEVGDARKEYGLLNKQYGEGSKELRESEKALSSAEGEYGKLSKAVEKTSKEIDNSEFSLNKAERELNKIRGSLDRTTQNMQEFQREQEENNRTLVKFGRGLQDGADHLDKFGDQMDTVAEKSALLSAVVAGIGIFAGSSALSMENSTVRMQNSLGLTEDAAADLAETSKRIYEDGFGDSLEEVDSALLQVRQNIRDLNDEDLENITQKALILSNTFDTDVNEVTRAANNLMAGFGIEADEAFDLMAHGAQNGLNFSNELFDNLSEYSTLFGTMGYSAEEYFQLLQAGLDAGAYNLDYINDVMKEFQIRIKDGSKGTSEAMAQMSEETQGVWQSFLDGGATVKDVMAAVTGDLEGMEDQTKANELGVQLFGTKFEDLEAEAVYALGNVDGELEGVNGTMDEMGRNMEESISQRALSLWREAKDTLMPLGETLLDVAEDALPAFERAIQTTTDTIEDMEPETLKSIAALGGFLVIATPVAKAFSVIAKGAAPVIRGVGKVTEKLGKFDGGAARAAGSAGLLAGGAGKLAGAVGLLNNPLGWAVGLVAAVGGGFAIAYDKVDWFRNSVDLAFETMTIFAEGIYEMTALPWLGEQFGNLWDKTEGFRESVTLTMDAVGAAIGDTFNEKIVEPFENFKAMHREAGESVDVFEEGVSEATTLALEDYVNFSVNAKLALDELYYGQQEVTQAQVEDVQEKYSLMNEEALLKLQERRENELAELQFLFEETGVLNDIERERILEKTNAHYNTEEDQLNQKNERIQEIIALAMETEGGLQSHHYEQIEMLQNDHNERTVETLSQGEIEQQAILERMQTNQLATSEATVEQLIADSEKAKNKTVKDAATKRDEIVAEAIRQRDETGNLSEEEAQKIIDEAEKQYNETVRNAENKHADVISEAAAQAAEHGVIVDGETGDILSKWDVFAMTLSGVMNNVKDNTVQKWKDMWAEVKGWVEDGVNGVARLYNWLMDQLGLDGAKLNPINITGYSSNTQGGYTRLPSYATGTNYHPGGLALVNDGGGPEIIQTPDGQMFMTHGENVLTDMPAGSTVYPHTKTKEIVNNMIPKYAEGTGGWLDELKKLRIGIGAAASATGDTLAGKASSAWDSGMSKAGEVLGKGAATATTLVSDVMSYANNPGALIEKMLGQFGVVNPLGGLHGEILSHMIGNFTSALTDKAKEMFAATATPVPGILDPSNISYHYGHTAKYTAETGRYWHSGVDFPFVYQSVRTPIGGTVTHQPFDSDGYGKWLTLNNGGTKLTFAHLSAYGTSNGEQVGPGDVIGTSGNTGFSTGPHLHFEYADNGRTKNPAPWLGSYENGGLLSQHGLYEGAEGNKMEMVLPLTNRNRSIELMEQAKALMGMNNHQAAAGGGNSEIISKLEEQLKVMNGSLKHYKQMVELLISINAKELHIGDDEIGQSTDRYNQRQSSKQRMKSGRLNYGL